jgi:choline kinase
MMFAAAGITDVCVVAGYHKRIVAKACRGKTHVIENSDWATTNSLYSLTLAKDWVTRDLVVVNCDVLVEPIVVSKLIRNGGSRLAIDRSSGDDDEHMKVQLAQGKLVAMSKSLDTADVHGENVGILHFSARDASLLFSCAEQALDKGGPSQWMAAAIELLAQDGSLHAMDISVVQGRFQYAF